MNKTTLLGAVSFLTINCLKSEQTINCHIFVLFKVVTNNLNLLQKQLTKKFIYYLEEKMQCRAEVICVHGKFLSFLKYYLEEKMQCRIKGT
jgi:hypothetical protein